MVTLGLVSSVSPNSITLTQEEAEEHGPFYKFIGSKVVDGKNTYTITNDMLANNGSWVLYTGANYPRLEADSKELTWPRTYNITVNLSSGGGVG